jgi:hypothetical protein
MLEVVERCNDTVMEVMEENVANVSQRKTCTGLVRMESSNCRKNKKEQFFFLCTLLRDHSIPTKLVQTSFGRRAL